MSAKDHRRLLDKVTLAIELGARVIWRAGDDVAQELLNFAREQGITMVLFGKSRRAFLDRLRRKSPIDAFTRLGTGIDVFEIETGTAEGDTGKERALR